MILNWSLRFRIFLFFALIAVGAMAISLLASYVGFTRFDPTQPGSAFILTAAISCFFTTGLVAWVWLLFDEHVAKPIGALASLLRIRAHSRPSAPVSPPSAKYLGDLGPAALTAAEKLTAARQDTATEISKETVRITTDKDLLSRLAQEVPLGLIVCTKAHRIALYNRAAENLLGRHCPIGLDRKLSDLITSDRISSAFERLKSETADHKSIDTECKRIEDGQAFSASVFLIDDGTADEAPRGYAVALHPIPLNSQGTVANGVLTRPAAPHPALAVPTSGRAQAAFDFGLLESAATDTQERTELAKLPFVVFDTETTGLRPDLNDEIVQIAAVRIINGNVSAGDFFDTLVDPKRPIPERSTKIHGITSEMVGAADDITVAGNRFHRYLGDAILVAHNAPFDLAFLRKHEATIGHRFGNPTLDTILLSAVLFGRDAEHSLDALAGRFGIAIPDDERHTALGDAIATARTLECMLPILAGRGILTLQDAFDACKPYQKLLTNQPSGRKIIVQN